MKQTKSPCNEPEKTIIGIDPGPRETAYAVTAQNKVVFADKVLNEHFLYVLGTCCRPLEVAIESISCYGMAVGRETFETCYMIGRIIQRCADLNIPITLYPRPEYMRSICGCKPPKGKADSTLWQALKLRFGGDKKGEPLNLLKGCSDKRSAYAVAVYHLDLTRG